MKKTKYALSVLAIIISVLISGCHKGEMTTEVQSQEKESLVFWSYFETDAQRKGLDDLVKGFNNSQDKYQLSWQYIPMTEFNKEISRSYTEQGLPDMVLIDNPDMQALIRNGVFEDITDMIIDWNLEEEYYEAAVKTVKLEDRYYGIPFNCNNLGLIYNKDLLTEMGISPPKSLAELTEAAKKLSTAERSGFLISTIQSEQGAFQLIPWLLNDEESMIDSDRMKEAFQMFDHMVESGYMSADCMNLSQTDVARKFIAGETAMMENGPWILSMLDEAGVSYGITRLPGVSRMPLGGENMGIIKGKNVEGSLAFLRYCQGSSVMETFCKNTGALPARKEDADNLVKIDPRLEIFEEQMEYVIPRTEIPDWKNISKQLPESFFQMIAGEKEADEIYNLLQNSFE